MFLAISGRMALASQTSDFDSSLGSAATERADENPPPTAYTTVRWWDRRQLRFEFA